MGTSIDRYDYDLPEELIATKSVEPRDTSRLLTLDRRTGAVRHGVFRDIVDHVRSGDVFVFNNSKVFKARLRAACGGKTYEVFLLLPDANGWQAMIKRSRTLRVGELLDFGHGLHATLEEKNANGTVVLRFFEENANAVANRNQFANRNAVANENVFAFCEAYGEIPTPPYVSGSFTDAQYQTVYAQSVGSVAAPTAGFHFTPDLLRSLKDRGVTLVYITLHVGIGTFQPVRTDVVEDHTMHAEFVEISKDAARAILQAKKEGRRVIAVGTTTTRALEGWGGAGEGFFGEINIFITPGYTFKMIDALITNFHLPKTTLLVLVSTFGGYERVRNAYKEAIKEHYRFYSFGDAMFIQ